jgi:hypothetical protein
MLSDVTVSFANQSYTLPGLYLLVGVLIVLGLSGFVVAIASARRIERKASETTDILVVQLERIGDSLDRILSQYAQTAARPVAEPARPRDRTAAEWPLPTRGSASRVIPEGSPLERAAQKPAAAVSAVVAQDLSLSSAIQTARVAEVKVAEEQPLSSNLSEPARSILFSMLGR